jgi:hypothetical protein
MNKYEQLIEHIINDEEDKARALFHQIVVEKSRDIYESLMDEEYAEEGMQGHVGGGDETAGLIDEITMDETDGIGEGDDDMDMGDMGDDDSMDNMGDDEGDLEQKVMDLESELEALKAEFEQLMGDEEGDMDDMDMDAMDMGDMDSEEDEEDEDNFAMMEAEKEEDDEKDDEKEEMEESVYESRQRRPLQKTAVDLMREYVEKISSPSNTEGQPAGTSAGGDHASVNTQSTVAGKNDMGGTAKNLAQGASESAPDGTSAPKKGTVKDVKDASNWENKPGANAGKTFSHKAKAKAGEGQTTDGSVPVNKTSIEKGGN